MNKKTNPTLDDRRESVFSTLCLEIISQLILNTDNGGCSSVG